MQTTAPKSLRTISILLVLLVILSLVSALMSSPLFFAGNRQPGNFPQGGNFQNDGGNFQRDNGNPPANRDFQGGGNFQPGNGNFPQRSRTGVFNLSGILRTLGVNGQVMIYINYGITLIGAILTGLAAFWVWNRKKTGLNLAMIVAIFFLLGSLGGVFAGLRIINVTSVIRYAIGIYNVGAALVILGMGILPSVRDEVS